MLIEQKNNKIGLKIFACMDLLYRVADVNNSRGSNADYPQMI
jgi:hypothetical protein